MDDRYRLSPAVAAYYSRDRQDYRRGRFVVAGEHLRVPARRQHGAWEWQTPPERATIFAPPVTVRCVERR